MGEACECKRLKYAELEANTKQRGWKAKVHPVEVGCRDSAGMSTTRLLKEMRI